MSQEIRFRVYGKPQTAGSKRAFPFQKKNGKLGVAVSDDNKRSKVWQSVVADAALERLPDGFELIEGPLHVSMVFLVGRPKGHFRTGKFSDQLKPSAPIVPQKKPDVLKLARAVEDALTDVIWKDDAQIVYEELQKAYGERPGVKVFVKELELAEARS